MGQGRETEGVRNGEMDREMQMQDERREGGMNKERKRKKREIEDRQTDR